MHHSQLPVDTALAVSTGLFEAGAGPFSPFGGPSSSGLTPRPPAGPSPSRSWASEDTYASANRRLKPAGAGAGGDREWEQRVLAQQLAGVAIAPPGAHNAFPARRHAGANASQALAQRRQENATRVRQERAAIQSSNKRKTGKGASPRRNKTTHGRKVKKHHSMPSDMSKASMFAEPW
jgi:hypothetical protein